MYLDGKILPRSAKIAIDSLNAGKSFKIQDILQNKIPICCASHPGKLMGWKANINTIQSSGIKLTMCIFFKSYNCFLTTV